MLSDDTKYVWRDGKRYVLSEAGESDPMHYVLQTQTAVLHELTALRADQGLLRDDLAELREAIEEYARKVDAYLEQTA